MFRRAPKENQYKVTKFKRVHVQVSRSVVLIISFGVIHTVAVLISRQAAGSQR